MFYRSITAFFLAVQALHLAGVTDPTFSYDFLTAHLHDLNCTTINAVDAYVNVSDMVSAVNIRGGADAACQLSLDMGNYSGILYTAVVISPSEVLVVSTDSDDDDSEAGENKVVRLDACSLQLKVTQMKLDPPNALLDYVLSALQVQVEEEAETFLCRVLAPKYVQMLMERAYIDATQPEPTVPGSLSLAAWPPMVAAHEVLQTDVIRGLQTPRLDCLTNSTAQLRSSFSDAKHIRVDVDVNTAVSNSSDIPQKAEERFQWLVDLLLSVDYSFSGNQSIPGFPGVASGVSIAVDMDRLERWSVDIGLRDLRCDDSDSQSYGCHVPREGGIHIANLRESTDPGDRSDVGLLLTNVLAPQLIVPLVNRWIQTTLSSTDSGSAESVGDRWYIPIHQPRPTRLQPPTVAIAAFVSVSVFLSCGLVYFSVRRQRCRARRGTDASLDAAAASDTDPLLASNGDAVEGRNVSTMVSERRIVLEDGILAAAVFACVACFAWSNSTTAAEVLVGNGELVIYNFSLVNTVQDLWGAGLRFLSVAVFLFSCVYPYLKLFCILLYTIVLEAPDSAVLHFIDHFGRFSFLDTLVLVIMVRGMEAQGIAEVRILTSFYVFLSATIMSIAIGNYATTFWRFGTPIKTAKAKMGVDDVEQRSTDATQASSDIAVSGGGGVADSRPGAGEDQQDVGAASPTRCPLGGVQWWFALPCGVLSAGCLLRAWGSGCIEYHLGGLAPLVTDTRRLLTLADLASVDGACYATILTTVVVAPILSALLFPRCRQLSSWCAPDVLLLASFAGLLQLNQFVQFVIGKEQKGVFTAHATLKNPLLLVFVAATLQWIMSICAQLHVDLGTKVRSVVVGAGSCLLGGSGSRASSVTVEAPSS